MKFSFPNNEPVGMLPKNLTVVKLGELNALAPMLVTLEPIVALVKPVAR